MMNMIFIIERKSIKLLSENNYDKKFSQKHKNFNNILRVYSKNKKWNDSFIPN